MGKITVSLIRRRAEHNEGEIQSLEEISLHQEKLERIELLDKVCTKLKILLLQNNSISKIENVSRLKNLEYLNLALNAVEKVENLEGCESLKKLDLTLNFIGEITSLGSLKPNYFLEQLYLNGNPCHEFPGYRDYVITILPQLKQLDGQDVTKSERLSARQTFEETEATILLHQEAYLKERASKKKSKKSVKNLKSDNEQQQQEVKESAKESVKEPVKKSKSGKSPKSLEKSVENRPKTTKSGKSTVQKSSSKDEEVKEKENPQTDAEEEPQDDGFWDQVTENTPEARLEMNQRLEKQDEEKAKKSSKSKPPPPPRRLETDDGRPLNVNEPKLSFTLHDEMERNQIVLDLAVPRFLCTTLIDADVQPSYVRVTVKGKIFQLVLPDEVKPDSSYAQRSQTTGHLIVTMPKVYEHSALIWRGGSGPLIELKKPGSATVHRHDSKSRTQAEIATDKKSSETSSPKSTKSLKKTDTTTVITGTTAPGRMSPPNTFSSSPKTGNSTCTIPLTPPPMFKTSKKTTNAGIYSAKVPTTPTPPITPAPAAATGVKGKEKGPSGEVAHSVSSHSNRKMTSSQLFAWNLNDVPPLI